MQSINLQYKSIEDLTSLINQASNIIEETIAKDVKEAKSTIEVWTETALLNNPKASTLDITKEINLKAHRSYTQPKTNLNKCIEDCNNCKYLNHKTASSRTCHKYGNVSLHRANHIKGDVAKTTLQAHLSDGLEGLNEDVMNGTFWNKIELTSNDKLDGIPTLNMPNIFLQVQFMQFVENNPKYMELPTVALLYAYFKQFAMCKNCKYCNGLCYNNKLLIQYKGKCISELRNLVGFILDKPRLKNIISNKMGNTRLFRIHGNGEFHSRASLEFWLDVAKDNKDVKFYTYTKSYEIVEEYLQEGNKFPSNFILNVSLIDGMQDNLQAKYPLLMQHNKFVIILKKDMNTDKKATVCGGNCLKCAKGCHTKLRTESKTIYVVIH